MKKFLSTIDITREDWLRARKKGITGTDAAAIVGVSPFKSAVDVFIDKKTEEPEIVDNERLRLGRDLEEYVASRFEEETSLKLKKTEAIYQSDENDFQLADFDRFVEGENSIVELKTVSPYVAHEWLDSVPIYYQFQCQHYLAVSGVECCYIAALVLGQDFIIRKINREPKVIQSLTDFEKDFWENNILNNVLPEPNGSESCGQAITELFPKEIGENSVDLNGFSDLLAERQELDEQIKKLTCQKNQIDQKIKLELKTNPYGFSENFKVSWKETNQTKFDVSKFKNKHPELYNNFLKTTSTRRFLIKNTGGKK